jgi:hypothetical protein
LSGFFAAVLSLFSFLAAALVGAALESMFA